MRRSLLPLIGAVLTSVALTGGLAAPAATAATAVDKVGDTTVVVDPALYAFLGSAGVEVAPTGKATAAPFEDTVAASFPIKDIVMDGVKLTHAGGLDFSAGDVNILAKRYIIRLDLERVTGRVTGSEIGDAGRVPIFKIQETDAPELGAVKLVLTKKSADAFNATFGVDAFAKGATFGYATPVPDAAS